MTCAPAPAWLSVINGRPVVEDGELKGVNLPQLVQQHNQTAKQLLVRAGVA